MAEGDAVTTTVRERFGALLKRYRLAAGLTQEALAERAGLSARAVSDLERDPDRLPRSDSIVLLGDALALTTSQRAMLRAAARPTIAFDMAPTRADPVLTLVLDNCEHVGGSVKAIKTTPLMTIDEAIQAMPKGAATASTYRPPATPVFKAD